MILIKMAIMISAVCLKFAGGCIIFIVKDSQGQMGCKHKRQQEGGCCLA
ncbi:hypothetical protein SAMN05192534_1205 [Alteribacillus persepolensis]|uniref:Uncharacterized protein n=1 Tax=Alteribacillus persepolensis TaxID=568899 RepID=A0A1G8HH65_9BACI|nr:hypothetical protein SAMN05192534_1205 [Alteribacillus persepolensis]